MPHGLTIEQQAEHYSARATARGSAEPTQKIQPSGEPHQHGSGIHETTRALHSMNGQLQHEIESRSERLSKINEPFTRYQHHIRWRSLIGR
jgi:hypothetical protein